MIVVLAAAAGGGILIPVGDFVLAWWRAPFRQLAADVMELREEVAEYADERPHGPDRQVAIGRRVVVVNLVRQGEELAEAAELGLARDDVERWIDQVLEALAGRDDESQEFLAAGSELSALFQGEEKVRARLEALRRIAETM